MGAMRELLKTCFGYDDFLPMQAEIIGAVLNGQDCFALMPTGAGKSLCYQLPAMAQPGLTLVVSPLIALMKDQVDSLAANGLPAAFINSAQTPEQVSQAIRGVRAGEIRLLYAAPERVNQPDFADFLRTLDVRLVAIDEAHCVSEWGHDFRPDYRELAGLRRVCPDAPIIALTATATPPVRADILSQLGLRQPQIFISSFNRPNLSYHIAPKERDLSGLLTLLERHKGESAIIYCGSRKAAEELAQTLSERGFKTEAYHAGLESDQRRSVQDRFIRDTTPIVAATIAFGMGINKPDVRLVVHYDLPKSIESYYQETGRAGRDGLPGECVLYYDYRGKARQEYFINRMEDAAERERARDRLERVISFCNNSGCRRKFVLEYLGEEWPNENCGACDNCLQPREQYDATEIAQKALSAVIRSGERFGAAHVIDVLRGGNSERIRQQGHDKLSVYGIAANHSRDELRDVMENLKATGFLAASPGEYPTLSVTARGREFLRNRESLTLARPITKRPETAARESRGGESYNAGLFNELSALRRQIADHNRVPPFVVFSDRSLRDMATKIPRDRESFARIFGVGETKLREFSGPFLRAINAYLGEHSQERGTPESAGPVDSRFRGNDGQRGNDGSDAESAPRGVGQSYRETGEIISGGASIEDAAAARGLSTKTILGHLERLVELGMPIQLSHLLPPPQRRAAIETVFEIMGDNPLRPVWEELGGQYSYDEIRLVRMARRRPSQPRPGPTADNSPASTPYNNADPRSMMRYNRPRE